MIFFGVFKDKVGITSLNPLSSLLFHPFLKPTTSTPFPRSIPFPSDPVPSPPSSPSLLSSPPSSSSLSAAEGKKKIHELENPRVCLFVCLFVKDRNGNRIGDEVWAGGKRRVEGGRKVSVLLLMMMWVFCVWEGEGRKKGRKRGGVCSG